MKLSESDVRFVWCGRFCWKYAAEEIQMGLNDAVRVSISSEQNFLGLVKCICSREITCTNIFVSPIKYPRRKTCLLITESEASSLIEDRNCSWNEITSTGVKFDCWVFHRRYGLTCTDGCTWTVDTQSRNGSGQTVLHTSTSYLDCPFRPVDIKFTRL